MPTLVTSTITIIYLYSIYLYNILYALQEGYKHANKKLSNQIRLLSDGVFSQTNKKNIYKLIHGGIFYPVN